MRIQKNENETYLILSPDIKGSPAKDDVMENLHDELNEKFITFKNKNIILDFSELLNTDVRKILLFSHLSGKQKERNQSFVVVSQRINVDEVPEDLDVVPSLQEAIDVIEMDNIQRDLGI